MKVKSNWIKIVSYLYISVSFMIFLIGWLKIYIAIPLMIIFLVALVLAIKEDEFQKEWIQYRMLFFATGIVCIWVLLAGIGGYVWQTPDHRFRNTIFSNLIDFNWPLVGPAYIDGSMQYRGLCYYFGIFNCSESLTQ